MTTVNARDPAFAGGLLGNGTDETAALNVARDAAGVGGRIILPVGTFLLNNFQPLDQQTIEGQGESTILKAATGAPRVISIEGRILVKLQNFKVDGNAKASDGIRIRGLNNSGGTTSQRHLLERVRITQCAFGLVVDGATGTPSSEQVDKNTYLQCMIDQCDVGAWINSSNAQEQMFLGGDISDCTTVGVRMGGGDFSMFGGQMQQTNVGTGKIMEFTGGNVDWVYLADVITEGHLTGFDSTVGNNWPLLGVVAQSCVLQTASGASNLAIVDRGGSAVPFVCRETRLNSGVVLLRGNDTTFHEVNCTGTRTVSKTGASVEHVVERFNARYAFVTAAATITIPEGAKVVRVTGATGIGAITAGYAGQEVQLIFASNPVLTPGATLQLQGGVVFNTAVNNALRIFYDEAIPSWVECGRRT